MNQNDILTSTSLDTVNWGMYELLKIHYRPTYLLKMEIL